MTTIKQIDQQIEELIKQIEKLIKQIEKLTKQKEELIKLKQEKDFIEIKHNNKTFRIYKWESKPVGNFKYPKGFRMAEFQEFIDLLDSEKYKPNNWIYHWVNHFSKLQWNKEWCLSGVFFGRIGSVDSIRDYLQDSSDYGRVVCCKNDEVKK